MVNSGKSLVPAPACGELEPKQEPNALGASTQSCAKSTTLGAQGCNHPASRVGAESPRKACGLLVMPCNNKYTLRAWSGVRPYCDQATVTGERCWPDASSSVEKF